jgi:hypothetical protein
MLHRGKKAGRQSTVKPLFFQPRQAKSGKRARLACWLESLAVASHPLQRRRTETIFGLYSGR